MKHRMQKMISLTMVIILLLVAFAGCGNANSNDEDIIPMLSDEKEIEFKELFYNQNKDNYPSLTLDNLTVNYLGEFNGSYAVMFEFGRFGEHKTDYYEVVGGFEFAYDFIQPVTIIKDNEMHGLKEAYDSGIITDEALPVLFKRYRPTCHATVENDFSPDTLFVKVLPSYNFKEYTTDDFSEINCVEVRELFTDKEYEEGKLERWLMITIKSSSKKATLKTVKKLEQRDDVFCVELDYIWQPY